MVKGFLCEKDANLGAGYVKENGFVLHSSARASPTAWPLGCCHALSAQVQNFPLVTHFLFAFLSFFFFSPSGLGFLVAEVICFLPLFHHLSENTGCIDVCISH